jgi:hypothetical protein
MRKPLALLALLVIAPSLVLASGGSHGKSAKGGKGRKKEAPAATDNSTSRGPQRGNERLTSGDGFDAIRGDGRGLEGVGAGANPDAKVKGVTAAHSSGGGGGGGGSSGGGGGDSGGGTEANTDTPPTANPCPTGYRKIAINQYGSYRCDSLSGTTLQAEILDPRTRTIDPRINPTDRLINVTSPRDQLINPTRDTTLIQTQNTLPVATRLTNTTTPTQILTTQTRTLAPTTLTTQTSQTTQTVAPKTFTGATTLSGTSGVTGQTFTGTTSGAFLQKTQTFNANTLDSQKFGTKTMGGF